MIKWIDIKGYEGRYQISSNGQIKSLERRIGYGGGYIQKERILTPQKGKDDYFQITLSRGRKDKRTYHIHLLVFRNFVTSDVPALSQICHYDGNKHNNNVSNLYLGDAKTNALDKYRQGRTKLSIEQINEIRQSILSQNVLAKKYGVRQPYISRIKNGTRATTIPNSQSILIAHHDTEINATIIQQSNN